MNSFSRQLPFGHAGPDEEDLPRIKALEETRAAILIMWNEWESQAQQRFDDGTFETFADGHPLGHGNTVPMRLVDRINRDVLPNLQTGKTVAENVLHSLVKEFSELKKSYELADREWDLLGGGDPGLFFGEFRTCPKPDLRKFEELFQTLSKLHWALGYEEVPEGLRELLTNSVADLAAIKTQLLSLSINNGHTVNLDIFERLEITLKSLQDGTTDRIADWLNSRGFQPTQYMGYSASTLLFPTIPFLGKGSSPVMTFTAARIAAPQGAVGSL